MVYYFGFRNTNSTLFGHIASRHETYTQKPPLSSAAGKGSLSASSLSQFRRRNKSVNKPAYPVSSWSGIDPWRITNLWAVRFASTPTTRCKAPINSTEELCVNLVQGKIIVYELAGKHSSACNHLLCITDVEHLRMLLWMFVPWDVMQVTVNHRARILWCIAYHCVEITFRCREEVSVVH